MRNIVKVFKGRDRKIRLKPPSEKYRYLPELPAVINIPYPYITIGDLTGVVKRIDPTVSETEMAIPHKRLFDIEQRIIPQEATLVATSGTLMSQRLGNVALKEANRLDKKVGVVIIDRYIKSNVDHSNFFRLNISRDINWRLVARSGTAMSPQEQFHQLSEWVTKNNFQEVVLIDEGLAMGNTLIPIIRELQSTQYQKTIRVIVGTAASGGKWTGVEKIKEATGIDVECLTLVKVSEPSSKSIGMGIGSARDMTIFGGYLLESDFQGRRIAAPTFLPFSITPAINLTAQDKRLEAAKLFLDFNIELIDFLEKRLKRPLVMQDLLNAGFAMPYSNLSIVKTYLPYPQPEDKVRSYVINVQQILNEHKEEVLTEVNLFEGRDN